MITNYSAVIKSKEHSELQKHLLRTDFQEDLCFALYNKSVGEKRFTGIICKIILPKRGERKVKGNVKFYAKYFERVIKLAIAQNKGIVFLHSHLSKGWQGMSEDDLIAESRLSAASFGATGVPLLGITMGIDGTCSARFWLKDDKIRRKFNLLWCENVRIISKSLNITFNDNLMNFKPDFQRQIRTISAWGIETQNKLANIRIGIVGLGSVGSIVAETLSRIGIRNFTLVDFDKVEIKNLDRMVNVFSHDIGRLKVDVIEESITESASSPNVEIEISKYSICEKQGYKHALDCDVIFCCVDRPWPRQVLNFISYAHLIPVIDGGIFIRTDKRNKKIVGADWKAQTVGYQRPCLECLGQYKTCNATLEKSGLGDDPKYIAGLEGIDLFGSGENVFVFSNHLASLEVLQFLSLIIAPSDISDMGQQVYHFVTGTMDILREKQCNKNCFFKQLIGLGDNTNIEVWDKHERAEMIRKS